MAHERLYYVHIPKTGGSYVRGVLKGHMGGKALNVSDDYRVRIHGNHANFHTKCDPGHVFDDPRPLKKSGYLRIATVRNPFDMLVSMNRFGSHQCGGHFGGFIDAYAKGNRGHPCLRKFLFHQIFDDYGSCQADVIIRSEFLREGLTQVAAMLEPALKIRLPKQRANSSKRNRDYRIYYNSPNMIEMIEKKCMRELKLFGYTFNGPVDNNPFVHIDPDVRYNVHSDALSSTSSDDEELFAPLAPASMDTTKKLIESYENRTFKPLGPCVVCPNDVYVVASAVTQIMKDGSGIKITTSCGTTVDVRDATVEEFYDVYFEVLS